MLRSGREVFRSALGTLQAHPSNRGQHAQLELATIGADQDAPWRGNEDRPHERALSPRAGTCCRFGLAQLTRPDLAPRTAQRPQPRDRARAGEPALARQV